MSHILCIILGICLGEWLVGFFLWAYLDLDDEWGYDR